MTTYLDAAYQILQHAGQPLRYEEITERALAQQLISPQGLTPEATMASRLYTDTLQEGSRFTRVSKGVFGLVDWQPAGIEAQVQQINQATREQLSKYLHDMPFDRFESLIGELLIQMGFDERTVTVTKRSGDGGIDVMGVYRAAGLTEVNAAVQVKRWKGNIQAPTVTSLRGSLQVHQQGIIITTSDFSKGAREEAACTQQDPHRPDQRPGVAGASHPSQGRRRREDTQGHQPRRRVVGRACRPGGSHRKAHRRQNLLRPRSSLRTLARTRPQKPGHPNRNQRASRSWVNPMPSPPGVPSWSNCARSWLSAIPTPSPKPPLPFAAPGANTLSPHPMA